MPGKVVRDYGFISPMTAEQTNVLKLHTAEEVSARLGRVSAATIRRLTKQGRIEWVRGARGKVLLTETQVVALVQYLTQPTRPQVVYQSNPQGVDALTSARSRSRAGHR